jgi:hypothetical protein
MADLVVQYCCNKKVEYKLFPTGKQKIYVLSKNQMPYYRKI